MDKLPITVVVSVKNEAINLPRCLERLEAFPEVIVVDSNSTDRTPEIVREFGYTLVNFNWNGKFPKKRNWTLQNVPIQNDWVLFLDADEFLTPEFTNTLKRVIPNTTNNGFWLSYNNYFMGRELRFGDKMKKLALFRKDKGAYERIEEDSWSHLDMEIHEHPIVEGTVGAVSSPIIHRDFKSLEHYIARHNAYSSWEAQRFLQMQKDKKAQLNGRQRLKYRLLRLGILPWLYFFGSYAFKLGFLDGKEGYYFAKYKSHYFFQIQTKIKELKRSC